MYKIQINDTETTSQAIKWCMKNMGKKWSMYPSWPNEGALFVFNQERDASWFSLHWH